MMNVVAIGGVLLMGACYPRINDISTDLSNPPRYAALADTPHQGAELAAAQRDAYPDVAPLVIQKPMAAVYALALESAEAMGWEIVMRDADGGRIEAVATTRLLRFKDDVIVRLTDVAGATRVDVRSKSRVGKGDLGANAKRIREYLVMLERRAN
jgi:uncharacterized protein (DUF1499 family)